MRDLDDATILQAAFDELPEATAVIDAEGVILRVNRAWRRFPPDPDAGGGDGDAVPLPGSAPGTHYIKAQPTSQAPGSAPRDPLRDGVRAVLEGRLPGFSSEYRWGSPPRQRWISLRVAPLGQDLRGAVIMHVDVTEQRLAEEAERAARERLASMTSAVPGMLYQYRQTAAGERRFIAVSRGVSDLFGIPPEAALSDPDALDRCFLAEDRPAQRRAFEQAAHDLSNVVHESRIRTPGGTLKWLHEQAVPQREADGSILWNGMLYDISGRKQTEQALAASEERWKFALEGAGEGVWDWNMLTGAALFSRRWKEMLGYSNEEIGDRADEWSSRVHPEDLPGVMATIQDHLDGRTPSATAEFRMRCRDGSWRWTLGRGMLVSRDDAGRPMRLVGTNADITERKLMEEQLHVLAFYDNLTRLPNRRLLGNRLSQLQAASRRTGCYGALMFLDLDHFKLLNDSHGHTVGDRLLTEAAERLKGCIRAADTAARFGGDEFVLLLGGLAADRQQAEALAEVIAAKAQARLAEPYQLAVSRADGSSATITHRCTVSIGVALFSGLEAREDDLLRLADRAMYQAKQSGRGAVRFA